MFTRLLTRIRAARGRRFLEARRAPTHAERELLEGRIDDWKEDVFAAGGDGSVTPTLPEAGTAEELYEEFERDEKRPRDPAP